MEQTIKLNKKLYNKQSRKHKGGSTRIHKFKRDIHTLYLYIKSLTQ